MAPRNPKNPIKDISDAVGGWLGGNRGTINPQVARVSRDLGTVAQTIDTFTGGLGAAAGRDVRNFAQGGSLPTNVAKTAAVNLAAGAGVGKVAQVAGRVVAKTGVPARVVNKLTRQQVMVHGTPNQISGGFISPRAGSVASPTQPVVFGWKPTKKLAINTVNSPLEYAKGSGNVVIGKVPKSAVSVGDTDAILKSTKPVKIVGQVKAPGNFNEYDAELRRMLKRAGANIDPGLVDKAKGAAKKAKTKRANKRSTF